MYIPQPVKVKLNEGIVETEGGIRKMTVVFMELLDLEVEVSEDKATLDQVRAYDGRRRGISYYIYVRGFPYCSPCSASNSRGIEGNVT